MHTDGIPLLLCQVAALKVCKRLENNWIVAMGLLNEQPHKLDEYVALKFEMRNFEQKFADAKAASEKMELKVQWDEYCAMEPVYEKARPQEAGNSSYIELTMKLFFQAVRFFETCYYSKGSEVLLFEGREHAVLGL